jgi:DNA-binding SARP family transcriptional activator
MNHTAGDTIDTIEISTFGQLRVQQGGRVLDGFISIKAVLLFVYLALHPGEHTRRKLATMFWSETNDQQALKNLRTVLSSLRQTVGDAVLIFRDTLAINPDRRIWVDAAAFETGCAAAFATPDAPTLLTDMQRLADLYQGVFLVDVAFRDAEAFAEWLSEQQRYLHQLYARLLYEIVEMAMRLADYDTGLGYARRLVGVDPYWEIAQRQLMTLLAYTHRTNEALLQYESLTRLLADELDAAPEDATTALYEQIRSRHLRPSQRPNRLQIELPDMPIVEAADELALTERMLNIPQCRLLTIHGISGVGKTVLATQIGYLRQSAYRDGAYFISLKDAQSARDLPYLIASAMALDLGNQSDPQGLASLLLAHLRDRHVLLILDNYEHLLPETAFVQQILEQAGQTQVIVTSQTPLNLFREWLLPLHGLRVPAPDEAHPETYEAVRLFEMTAQRMNPRFDLRAHLAGVVEICRLVEGLPLAVIMAAGWTQIAPIPKIIDYIASGQEFNLPPQQDLPLRHRSLELMLDYTWSTLTEAEQQALTALSVFATAFDTDEAQQIGGVAIDVLTSMIQKSLIQKDGDRYRMHQLVWRYARKKLVISSQKIVLEQRYLRYFTALLGDLQRQQLPLHEYLLAIETQYTSIWNYDWMATSFQRVYILSLSRYLSAYWEISRSDEMSALQTLIERIPVADLSGELRVLRHLQLARLHLARSRHEQAYEHLQQILADGVTDTAWGDWSIVFNLCLTVYAFARQIPPHRPAQPPDTDEAILTASYLKLLSLYLEMRDYEAVEGFFPHLLEAAPHPLDRAFYLAAWGAAAAEMGQYATTSAHFAQALEQLDLAEEPLLRQVMQALLTRASQGEML